MADTDKGGSKNLEMRVAELEDKLRSLHVTEDEMKAYNKVASLMAAPSAATIPATTIAQPCVVHQCTIRACTVVQCIRQCTIVQPCTVLHCTIQQCIQQCINECGGGLPGMGGGGFGTLGG